jgi:ligand-binding SRPBCC domain-containing protein
MANIHLTTFIAAPVERVFDLSRHIAIYKNLFQSRKEQFSSGAGGNLLNLNETISILGKIAGKTRLTMLKITGINKPESFTEEQVKGDLIEFKHQHHFKSVQNGTIIIDMIEYGLPKDFIGKIAGKFYLSSYLEELVNKRNELIRSYAETEKWRAILT